MCNQLRRCAVEMCGGPIVLTACSRAPGDCFPEQWSDVKVNWQGEGAENGICTDIACAAVIKGDDEMTCEQHCNYHGLDCIAAWGDEIPFGCSKKPAESQLGSCAETFENRGGDHVCECGPPGAASQTDSSSFFRGLISSLCTKANQVAL